MNLRTFPVLARAVAGLLLAATTASCTLTPEAQTPRVVESIRSLESFQGPLPEFEETAEVSQWWLRVGGDELSELVQILRRDSLLLAEARLQAEQALEQVAQARAQRLPAASLSADATSTRIPGPDGDSLRSEDYIAGLGASFDTDVFGRLRASERAARLNAMAAALSYRATEQREIAFLAQNWVSAATLQRRLDLARRNADSFRATYEFTDQRYRAGSPNTSASDVLIALQNLETARVDIPDLANQLQTQLLVIDEQLARLPGETAAVLKARLMPEYEVAMPLGQPASLLASRPDVAAAELRYKAALEDVGSARASLYPAITLSAALTFQDETASDLFDWDDYISNLAAALVQPIFQGGRLRSQVRLEQAQAEELANAFARVTLGAVIDVEISLADLAGRSEQRQRLKDAVASARASNDVAQNRYRQGLTSILAVLETQRSLNNAQQNLLLTEQALLNAQIDLFLSLGGDWTD